MPPNTKSAPTEPKAPKAPPTPAELRATFKLKGERALNSLARTTSRVEKLMQKPAGSPAQITFLREHLVKQAERLVQASKGLQSGAVEMPSE